MATLAESLNSHYGLLDNLDFILRLVLACICGGIIGYERTKRFKAAGIRTHILVSIGAALIMILSKYAFADLETEGGARILGTMSADAARLGAQVISGISFLGAGVILHKGSSVKGLTTAAGLWTTAAIGVAIGAGLIWPALLTTAIVACAQYFMHKYTIGRDSLKNYYIKTVCKDTPEMQERMDSWINTEGLQVVDRKISREQTGYIEYEVTFRAKDNDVYQEMQSFLEGCSEVKSLHSTYDE